MLIKYFTDSGSVMALKSEKETLEKNDESTLLAVGSIIQLTKNYL